MADLWPRRTVFAYHEVIPAGPLSRYSVSSAGFEAHLKLYRELGQRSSQAPRITFDDGHKSNFLHATPLLDRCKSSATFFVTVGFIGNRAESMCWPEVRSLLAAGHAIGAHGWSHRFLTECSDADLVHELIDAKACLEDHIGHSVTELSLPGGRYDERVLLSAAKAGYHTVYSSEPWAQFVVTGSLRLVGRAMVLRDTSMFHLSGLARQTLVAKNRVYAEHAVRSGLRMVLGNRYHALWSKVSGRPTQCCPNSEEHLPLRR